MMKGAENMRKKILIVSMKAGFGHLRAGQALADYANECLPEIHATHLDAGEIAPPLAKLFNQKIYETAVREFPELWGKAYEAFDHRLPARALRHISRLQAPFCQKLINHVVSLQPDAVIFTYVAVAQLLAPSCRNRIKDVKLAMVVTDYHGHSLYNIPAIDCFFVADDFVSKDLESTGVDPSKIKITGIPVKKTFYADYNRQKLKRKLGFIDDSKTILFISRLDRDFILPTLEKILNSKEPLNLIMVCGGNETLYQKIKKQIRRRKNFKILNWTNRLDQYMKAADIVVSKPGGLAISECLALGKKIIMVDPIPGQEERNAKFIARCGYGQIADGADQISLAVEKYLRDIKEEPLTRINACDKIFSYF